MFKRFMSPILMAIILAGSFGVLTGCNTVEGAGKDLQRGGAAISEEAREHK